MQLVILLLEKVKIDLTKYQKKKYFNVEIFYVESILVVIAILTDKIYSCDYKNFIAVRNIETNSKDNSGSFHA